MIPKKERTGATPGSTSYKDKERAYNRDMRDLRERMKRSERELNKKLLPYPPKKMPRGN